MTNYFVDGLRVALNSSNYVGEGGQGAVYFIGDTAYKIYADPSTMIPRGKINELSCLNPDIFIRPIRVIVDKAANVSNQ